MLELTDIHTSYGNIRALKGISLKVERGEIVTLIGANGAGKTTTLKTIIGTLGPQQGEVRFEGKRISGLPTSTVVRMGISHSPEGRRIFPRMTVLENLELGCRTPASRAVRKESLERVVALFPRLRERGRQLAGTLSGGEQQMCAIARGLMACPRLLMLDEPSLGLAPVMVKAIFDNLRRINAEGLTVLLVEQNVLRSLQLSRRGYVLENGRIALGGPAAELLSSSHIKQAYLGL